ncbi:MAG TPA: hypothetical protein VKB53_11605 [Gammaproteobacteria bacterium]|nr:hypothetical protein [Gammaproteobacteria bacterium]HKH21506.1 hypothetical protein [Gammaproteobacteria bacterium]
MFAALYLMHRISLVSEPSLKKAIHATQYVLQNQQYGDGKRISLSTTNVRDYWYQFKSVAHLWGAYRLNSSGYPFTPMPELMYIGFIPFLEVAAGLYRFGYSLYSASS